MADEFKEAIQKIQHGDESAGRKLMQSYVAKNPGNAKAWLWLATVALNDAERIEYLKRSLQIDPNNDTARRALANLTKKISHAASADVEYRSFQNYSQPSPGTIPARSAGLRLQDRIAGVIMIILLIGVGIGGIVYDRYAANTANAFLTEGRRINAEIVGDVTYWRKGVSMYCKVTYRFTDQGIVYENDGKQTDLDICRQMENTGLAEIEYLPANPSRNRIPWRYPEDYSDIPIGLICGGMSFLCAFFVMVYLVVPRKR